MAVRTCWPITAEVANSRKGLIVSSTSTQSQLAARITSTPPALPPLPARANDPGDPNPDSLVAVGDIKRLTAVAHFTAIINTLHVPEFEAVNAKRGEKKWGSWVAAVQGHWS